LDDYDTQKKRRRDGDDLLGGEQDGAGAKGGRGGGRGGRGGRGGDAGTALANSGES
jgi:hypothetical protein